jgi:cell division protein FtsB
MAKLVTLDDFLREARRLRDKADASEREFLEFLQGFEARRDLWQSHAPTFDSVISGICKPQRYRNWLAASEDKVIGPHARAIGVSGAVQAVRIADPEKRAEAVSEMVRSVAHHGTVLSTERARGIVARYAPERSTLPDPDAERAALKAEIERLRARVAQLAADNAELRRQMREVARCAKPPIRSRGTKPVQPTQDGA